MRLLMCPPFYLEVQEEDPNLNSWMKLSEQPDRTIAYPQWRELVKRYQSFGAETYFIKPVSGLGDMAFSANAAWRCGDIFIMSNFHPDVWWRREETKYYKKWLEEHGFKTHTLPENIYFEGQGDMVTVGNTVVYGWGRRNSPEIPDYLRSVFGLKNVVTVRLVDRDIYHNDLGLFSARWCKRAIWCPEGYDQAGINTLTEVFDKEGYEDLPLPKRSAIQELGNGRRNFLINSSYIGKKIIIPWRDRPFAEIAKSYQKYEGAPVKSSSFLKQQIEFLKDAADHIVTCDLSEFGMSGGSAKCLTLFLD